MITIVAEKPDVGNKIAAALDKIILESGKPVYFENLKSSEKDVKSLQSKQGYLKITWMGQECYVTWGYGHLCTLKQAADYNPEYKLWSKMPMPFIPQNYEVRLADSPSPDWTKRMHAQFKTVKDLMNKADIIINATDADREGEVIFAYIYELAGCRKPVQRAFFSSQTKQGIIDAFTKDLRNGSDMKYVEAAGRERGIADWVVGANLTAAISLKYPGEGVISVGRVQTPTLAMIVDREKKIRDFKSEPYWVVEAQFTADGETFRAVHENDRFTDKTAAQSVLDKVNGQKGKVISVTKKITKRDVPNLYSLSALQMDANALYGYSLDTTLKIVQNLYEAGYVTYPRTNSRFLTEDMEDVVNNTLDKLDTIPQYAGLIDGRARVFDKKHYFDNSKIESHFAIIPTGNIPKSLDSSGEQNVYDLICRSLIRMLYKEAAFENSSVKIDVLGEAFNTSGKILKEAGWTTVSGVPKTEMLPPIKEDDILEGTYQMLDKMTEPPKRYSEKSLLSAMLTAGKDLDNAELRKIMADPNTGGIGTEATRASIVETLLSRGYIERRKKSIAATDKGIKMIDALPVEDIKGAEMTARWEQRLKNIERGKEDPAVFRADIENAVRVWVNEIQTKIPKQPSAYKQKEKFSGKWRGQEISFNRKWGEHRFTDNECLALIHGYSIEFRYKGKMCRGRLAVQSYKGHSFVGFKADFGD